MTIRHLSILMMIFVTSEFYTFSPKFCMKALLQGENKTC